MADFPAAGVPPLSIHSYSVFSALEALRIDGVNPNGVSASWGSANRAIFIPFWLPWPYLVARVFWGNGSTANGNKDFGIYSNDGAKIYSTGSTAESGASVLQYVTPTAFMLPPGRYYFGISCSATTNHGWSPASLTAIGLELAGLLQQASSLPLPDSATFAASTGTILPLCGITRTASGF